MARRRATRAGAPSQYPRILFHALRSAQLLSSIVVSGIMCYFMYYLHMEKYPIPWTFIVLLTISIATMVSLLMTIILYNFTYLSPIFNLALNGSLSVVWALGLGLLSWSLSETLKKACDISEWGSEAGVMICRDYKALWSFTLIGLVSTISALCLDIYTNRKATKRGAYILPEDDKVTLRMENMLANNSRARGQGYDDEIEEIPAEEGVMLPQMDTQTAYQSAYAHEMDTSYHSSYGHEEHGDTTDIGKHGRFRD